MDPLKRTLQGHRHVGRALVPVLGFFLERAAYHRIEGLDARHAPKRRGFLEGARVGHVDGVFTGKREPSREHLVHDGAAGEQVRMGADFPSPPLLGSHVMRSTHDRSGRRHAGVSRPFDGQREAEVEQLDPVWREKDVRRFQVAVHHPLIVQECEWSEDVAADSHRILDAEALSLQAVQQALALEELHRHPQLPIVLAHIENLTDPGVVESRGRPRLAQKTLARHQVALVERLDRHGPTEPLILGRIHHTHTALAEDVDDPVGT
jgi:hypothetical protein